LTIANIESSLIYFTHNGTYIPGFNTDAKINFLPGKTYRLRIINTSALAMFYFWIDGHDMRIIEADGTDLQEAPTNMIALTVAQRFSVLITARNDTSNNWAIHADMDADMFDVVPDDLVLSKPGLISRRSSLTPS
jgi:iron transport multicopper oxidase